MRKRRLFVDMDGVLAKWNYVSIETVTTPGYFLGLAPQTTVVKAIEALCSRNEFEVYILSSVFVDNHSISEKNQWLDKYLPVIPEERRIFVPYGMRKTDAIENPSSRDILIDDFTDNLRSWHGIGIKLMNGINGTKGTWHGYSVNGLAKSQCISKTIMGISMVA